MIQRLKETQSTIEGQIADLSTKLLDGHPQMKGLRSQLAGIRTQIRAETQKVLDSLENEASVTRMREQQLLQQINTLKVDTASTEEKQVGLADLEREATAQRQLLETYLARYREAVSEKDMNATPADARPISSASLPTEPYFPKTIPIIAVATVAGLLLSSVFVMLSELFSGRALRPVVYDEEDDLAYEELPVEVVEPERRIVKAGPISGEPVAARGSRTRDAATQPARETARSLLSFGLGADEGDDNDADALSGEEFSIANVARHLVENDVNVAISVSPTGDVGSLATVQLARAVAGLGRKLILIDMTGSAVPSREMVRNERLPGITDLLAGEAPFAETIHGDRDSDAHILPHGTANAKRAMRGADRLSMIVDALAEAYDLVLVESGPADISGVSRIARKGQAEIIVSAADASAEEIEATAGAFIDAGYDDVVLMIGGGGATPPRRDSRAA